jgi:Flp pilus assembly protein TadG
VSRSAAARRVGPRRGRRRPQEGGAVTAETAVALPAVGVVAALLVAVGQAAAAHLQCVDAARAAARLAARGETSGLVRGRAAASAPAGSTVVLATAGGQVRVRVSAVVSLPLGLAVPVEGTAIADAEPGARGLP